MRLARRCRRASLKLHQCPSRLDIPHDEFAGQIDRREPLTIRRERDAEDGLPMPRVFLCLFSSLAGQNRQDLHRAWLNDGDVSVVKTNAQSGDGQTTRAIFHVERLDQSTSIARQTPENGIRFCRPEESVGFPIPHKIPDEEPLVIAACHELHRVRRELELFDSPKWSPGIDHEADVIILSNGVTEITATE